MQEQTTRWLHTLRQSGYRLTAARRAVVKILAESTHTMTRGEIFAAARKIHPSIGLVSVYRTLEKLEALHLVQRIHDENGCHTYFPAPTGHQHVLLCTRCGAAVFFDGDDLNPLIKNIGERTGYRIDSHWLQLFGVCPQCQEAEHEQED